MENTGIIPIILSVFVLVKTIVEVILTMRAYHNCDDTRVDCENEIAHMNHHIALMMGIILVSTTIIVMIVIGGFEFSDEWIAPFIVVDGIFAYLVEHFEHERRGIIRAIHPIKDLLSINFTELLKSKSKSSYTETIKKETIIK